MVKPLLGIDVSEYQGNIIWKDVEQSGHEFAAIKATEGLGYQDPTFMYNWHHAKEHGQIRMAYHFLRPEFNGAQQGSFLHSTVRSKGRFERGDGVMLDLEEMDSMSPNHVVACAEQFVQQILHETEAGVFIYTGYFFWVQNLLSPVSEILAKCPLWVASWHSAPNPINNWKRGASLQQYAADGRVPGIPNQVDLDWFFGSRETLSALCRLGGRH